jgi:hypothetical protein
MLLDAAAFVTVTFIPALDAGNTTESPALATVVTRLSSAGNAVAAP